MSPIKLSAFYLAVLGGANLLLLLPQANALRVAAALLLVCLLPGLAWSWRFFSDSSLLLRLNIAAALSYTITKLGMLLLNYMPGPIHAWHILLCLDGMALLPIVVTLRFLPAQATQQDNSKAGNDLSMKVWLPLLLVLGVGLFLRTGNLNYSEFQGDEALAMITAAETLEGQRDALFLRSKGPGEVLLPVAVWRLSGTINEATARLPFSLASLLAIVSMYLIGQHMSRRYTAWLVAGFFAFHGFAVAFGRIVQYQAFVLWFSAMAFLLLLEWQRSGQQRWAMLGGLCLGSGLLAHYDAILVLPALVWLLFYPSPSIVRHSAFSRSQHLGTAALFALGTLLVTLPFYLPFSLNPQASRTGSYLGQRIGNELRNNLPDFFHFSIFYSSAYFVIVGSLLIAGLFLWLAWQAGWPVKIAGGLGVAGMIGLALTGNLSEEGQWLAFLPFALTFTLCFFQLFNSRVQEKTFDKTGPGDALPGEAGQALRPTAMLQAGRWQAIILWLAVPFLGYNFVVALGLTHIYTIVPAWSILAALAVQLTITTGLSSSNNYHRAAVVGGVSLLFGLSVIFLWNAFVRYDIEYLQDYPQANLPLFWMPYDNPPDAGLFGFAHRAGWKAIGQKIADNSLSGNYGSNEEPEVTTWYTRGAPRACDPQPEFYFLADDLVDRVTVPTDLLQHAYEEIGSVILPNQKRLRIKQLQPASLQLGNLDEVALSRAFEQSSVPAAFARSGQGAYPIAANFGNLIQLIGYDVDTRRAYRGGRIPVTLYWQALAPIEASWQVFTHLEGETGLAAQADGVPVCWTLPTNDWRPGQIVADQHTIPVADDLAAGVYRLEVGLYLADSFERLDFLDQAGNPAGTSLVLESVEIR